MTDPNFPHVVTVQAPAIEPVSLARVRAHLRIDDNDSDDDLSELIYVASRHVETTISRALITQTIDVTFDEFLDAMYIPRSPLQSVTSVTYTDTAGAGQTLGTSVYLVDTNRDPGEVRLDYGQTWPDTYPANNAVTIRAVVGYGDTADDVPAPIRHAILMTIGDLYENRETSAPIMIYTIPFSVESLLAQYRRRY